MNTTDASTTPNRPGRHHGRPARSNDDDGLALIEVLLGMMVFAIITIVAVSAIGQTRGRAYEAQAEAEGKTVEQVKEESGVRSDPGAESQATPEPREPIEVPWTTILLSVGALVALGGAGLGGASLRRGQRRDELASAPAQPGEVGANRLR